MVLFIFGLYTPVVGLFISTRDENGEVIDPSIFSDMSNKSYFWGGLLITLVLLLGMLAGFILISKAMKMLIENNERGTFTMVIGFVLGSLVSMFFNNDTYMIYTNPKLNQPWQFILGGILFLIVGAAMLFLVFRKTKIQENSSAEQTDLEQQKMP